MDSDEEIHNLQRIQVHYHAMDVDFVRNLSRPRSGSQSSSVSSRSSRSSQDVELQLTQHSRNITRQNSVDPVEGMSSHVVSFVMRT
jgi:hypothetical protein